MPETKKAHERRIREGFFNYCKGSIIDIGAGKASTLEPPDGTVTPYDYEQGDANLMANVADESYDTVYSSHCLEHLVTPHIALQNWYRILKPGGYLIVVVPHRDLYERVRLLPSHWNGDHKLFFLPAENDPPHTWGLMQMASYNLPGCEIIYCKTCDEGWFSVPVEVHASGEYAIEIIIRKP